MASVIVVFGLSASGKSTLAQGLGRGLGLRVIHPSGLMRDLMEKGAVDLKRTRANDGYWESEQGVRRLRERLHQRRPIDVTINAVLLEEVEKGGVVIDSWSLPWLTERGIRIHLHADLQCRAERAARRAGLSVEAARRRIAEKDEETRQLFLRLYGFDISCVGQGRFHDTIDTGGRDIEQVLARALASLPHDHFPALG